MMFLNTVLIMSTLYLTCEAGLVDTLTKCSVKDDKCLMSLYQKILAKYGKTGIPEIGMPPLDPVHISNTSVIILDTIILTMYEASIEGISDCAFNSFHLDLEKQLSTEYITCDISVTGLAGFNGTNPALQSLIGIASVNNKIKGKVKLEKSKMHIVTPFVLFKKADGETYLRLKTDSFKQTYEIGKATFDSGKIIIGNTDFSSIANNIMNNNWRNIMNSSEKVYIDKSLESYYKTVSIFFENVPAKEYLIEDLTPYIKE